MHNNIYNCVIFAEKMFVTIDYLIIINKHA